jgi:hypothetical protein
MIAVRARKTTRTLGNKAQDDHLEFGDIDDNSDQEASDDANDNLTRAFGVMKVSDLQQESKLTDSDREILTNMKEIQNHSWKPVDSLVVSLGTNTERISSIKGSRTGNRTRCKTKREISFDKVIVREYAMTMGDNPSCSYGPPVCLDWLYLETTNLKLEEYERTRPRKRNMRQLVLNYYRRCEILESAGYDSAEMKRTTRQINRVKRQRDTTKFFAPVIGVEAVVRSAGRKVKRATKGGARSKE